MIRKGLLAFSQIHQFAESHQLTLHNTIHRHFRIPNHKYSQPLRVFHKAIPIIPLSFQTFPRYNYFPCSRECQLLATEKQNINQPSVRYEHRCQIRKLAKLVYNHKANIQQKNCLVGQAEKGRCCSHLLVAHYILAGEYIIRYGQGSTTS